MSKVEETTLNHICITFFLIKAFIARGLISLMCVFRLEQVIVHVGCLSIKDSQELVSTLLHIFTRINCIFHAFTTFLNAHLHFHNSSPPHTFNLIYCLSINVSAFADKQPLPPRDCLKMLSGCFFLLCFRLGMPPV